MHAHSCKSNIIVDTVIFIRDRIVESGQWGAQGPLYCIVVDRGRSLACVYSEKSTGVRLQSKYLSIKNVSSNFVVVFRLVSRNVPLKHIRDVCGRISIADS